MQVIRGNYITVIHLTLILYIVASLFFDRFHLPMLSDAYMCVDYKTQTQKCHLLLYSLSTWDPLKLIAIASPVHLVALWRAGTEPLYQAIAAQFT